MKLNCHVVGFDIDCHLGHYNCVMNIFMTSTPVVLIDFFIKNV